MVETKVKSCSFKWLKNGEMMCLGVEWAKHEDVDHSRKVLVFDDEKPT